MATTTAAALPPHSTNVEEELGRIQLALQAVFSPQPISNQQQQEQWYHGRQMADLYLQSFQSTPVAWMVCDRLLQQEGTDPQVYFFAAQTLHTKCRSDVHQLPTESLSSLRDSLLQHLTKFAILHKSSFALMTRLALAVSALAVQMSWTTVVPDLLSSCTQQQQILVALEILRVLPEECASDRLVLVDENVRYSMRDQLVQSSSNVLQFCCSLLKDNNKKERIHGAVHAWIRHVPVPPLVLVQSPILDLAIQELTIRPNTNEQLVEIAVDVVVEVLRMYPSHVQVNEILVQKLVPLLLSLQPSFQQAVQQQEVHEDLLRGYCRIVTEMGESYLSLITSSSSSSNSNAVTLVQWVLACSNIASAEISHMTLHFWYRFVMDLDAMEPLQQRQAVIDLFAPLLLELLHTCTNRLLLYPSDLEDLPQDTMEDVHRDRYYVAETVEDCCRLLGAQVVLKHLVQLLQEQCQLFFQNRENSTNKWQGIESCLFAIQAIHMFVPKDEQECLPFCFQLIPQLPSNIEPLRFTASLTVGKYAPWLAHHAERYMQPLMPFLAQGLSIPKCATAAAVAIKQLCECPNVSLGDAVLQLYQQVMAPTTQQKLELRDELEILEGVCKALTRQLQASSDTAAASTYLGQIIQPIGTRLNQLVVSPQGPDTNVQNTPQHVRQIVAEVERLTVVVRFWKAPQNHNSTQNPTVEIVQSTWSLLDAATRLYPKNTMLAEKICRFHKHALRTCGPTAYAPLLDSLLRQLVTSYEMTKQSPYLYCASICVTEFGKDPAYTRRLLEAIETMTKVTLDMFQYDLDTMIAHPDVVEELFYLMGRVLSYCKSSGGGNDLLANTPLVSCLFQLAIVGMRLDHRDANRGTLHFLESAIREGLDVQQTANHAATRQQSQAVMTSLEQVLTQQGQSLLNALVGSLVGELPSYSIVLDNAGSSGSVSGILWKLNLLCGGTLLTTWITTAMTSLSVPEQPKMEFLNSGFLNHTLTQDEFHLVVRAFVSACDRHRKLSKK